MHPCPPPPPNTSCQGLLRPARAGGRRGPHGPACCIITPPLHGPGGGRLRTAQCSAHTAHPQHPGPPEMHRGIRWSPASWTHSAACATSCNGGTGRAQPKSHTKPRPAGSGYCLVLTPPPPPPGAKKTLCTYNRPPISCLLSKCHSLPEENWSDVDRWVGPPGLGRAPNAPSPLPGSLR